MSSKYSVTRGSLHEQDSASDNDGQTARDTHRDSGLYSAASLEEKNYLDYDEEDDNSVDSANSKASEQKNNRTSNTSRNHQRRRHLASSLRQFKKQCRHCDSILVPLPASSEHACDKCSWHW